MPHILKMVKVNKADCIACGNCSSVCPEVFEMQDDGKAGVKKGQENSDKPCVDKAIAECPARCISK
jgi:ferredoxin